MSAKETSAADQTGVLVAPSAPTKRHNVNESIPRDFTDQELRTGGLRDALSYFTYVNMIRGAAGGPPPPPVGITTVLGIADHFADYVRDGSKPAVNGLGTA